MTFPFTIDQFFAIFAGYNVAIWPAQVVAYLLAGAVLILSFRQTRFGGRIVSAILALFWIWIGAVYHVAYFSAINPAALLFGAFFVVQGLLFLLVGAIQGRLAFRYSNRPMPVIGAILIVYAMVVYPLLGPAFGHTYPSMPTFGLTPCPTTIFTFGLLLLATAPVPGYLLIIPFLWSVIGTSAAVQLGVPQDYGLSVAAVLGVIMIFFANRARRSWTPPEAAHWKGAHE